LNSEINFQLRFPGGVLANCTSSYGYSGQNRYRVIATTGWFELEPATSYTGQRMRVRRGDATEERDIQPRDHFAAEMDHMSECVMNDKALPESFPKAHRAAGLVELEHALNCRQVSMKRIL
jgi:predicted dehydrogenase